jgi:hypothetical protein
MVTVGAVALVAAAAGCGGDDDDDEAAPEPPPETTSTAPPPVTPPQVPPGQCVAASDDDIVDIELSMTSFDTRLTDARTATVGNYRYVAGNLSENAGSLIGPAVWAFDDQVLYAVSDLAAQYSAFFPSRDPLGVAADDATVAALLRCVPPA